MAMAHDIHEHNSGAAATCARKWATWRLRLEKNAVPMASAYYRTSGGTECKASPTLLTKCMWYSGGEFLGRAPPSRHRVSVQSQDAVSQGEWGDSNRREKLVSAYGIRTRGLHLERVDVLGRSRMRAHNTSAGWGSRIRTSRLQSQSLSS